MSRFILSCTTCSLRAPHKDEVSETFKYAPAAGYKYWGNAGPALWTPYIGAWLDTARIKALAAEAGLIGCTEVYCAQIVTQSPEVAVKSIEPIVAQAEHTADMDCPLLVFTGGRRVEGTVGLASTVAGLEALMPRIEHLPIKIALEPHLHMQIQDAEDYDYIFDRIDHPQLGITIDIGHFHSAKVDTIAFIQKYASRIWNIHLKDHIGTQSVAIGAGEIDIAGIVRELHQHDYEGALALEIEPTDHDNLPTYVAESYPYLCDIVEEVTGTKPE